MKILGEIFCKACKKELSESDLDSIARASNIVYGAYQPVFNAFKEAGLSPREAVKATDRRLHIMIEKLEDAQRDRDLHIQHQELDE